MSVVFWLSVVAFGAGAGARNGLVVIVAAVSMWAAAVLDRRPDPRVRRVVKDLTAGPQCVTCLPRREAAIRDGLALLNSWGQKR